jgi:hypothetical protein
MLDTRIGIFTSLRIDRLDRLTLKTHLDNIGAAQDRRREPQAGPHAG